MKSATIEQYMEAKENLDHFKALEKKLRTEVLDALFPNVVEGTHTTLIDEFEIKGTFKLNHKLDNAAIEEKRQYFTAEEEECIAEKLSIVVGKYNKLPLFLRETLDECIITSNSLPSLKITESLT